jgi:integrase/recombinase XerD
MTKGLGKTAKILTDVQQRTLLRHVANETDFPTRNRVIVLLSFKAGMRAKEIGALTWGMVTDASGGLGDAIALSNSASKGKRGGRMLPMHPELRQALGVLYDEQQAKLSAGPDDFVIAFKKGSTDVKTRANSIVFLFKDWYGKVSFTGASSHSGRRTFITKAARKVSEVGGSLRDVMALAGHSNIAVTQRYVDTDPEAQRKLVNML